MIKFGNLNIRKILVKRIGAFALAGSMVATMVGCGSKKKLDVDIPVSATIGDTLDAVSHLTTMDEFLNEAVFVNRSDGKKYTFEELLKSYNEAREQKDLSKCNTILYKIGRMIMKAQFAEALNIKPEQIVSMSIDGVQTAGHVRSSSITYKTKSIETVSGGIDVTEEKTVTQEFVTVGEMDDLAVNIERAYNHALEFNYNGIEMDLDVDNVYKSFVEHLLTTPEINKVKVLFGDEYDTIGANLSQEKIDAFNDSNNVISSAPSKTLHR